MADEKVAECVPEWCEQGGPEHDDVCDNAPMEPMTKRRWIEHLESAAEQAIDAYSFLVADGFPPGEAGVMAVDEVKESGACYAGIGSCGRGWCKHS